MNDQKNPHNENTSPNNILQPNAGTKYWYLAWPDNLTFNKIPPAPSSNINPVRQTLDIIPEEDVGYYAANGRNVSVRVDMNSWWY
jgi:hypothetical protein